MRTLGQVEKEYAEYERLVKFEYHSGRASRQEITSVLAKARKEKTDIIKEIELERKSTVS